MAKQTINVGQPNTRTGDSLRVAFEKINSNFDELYSNPLPPEDVSDIGDVTGLIFSGNYDDLTGKPSQDDVALTGNYTSLNDEPSGQYTYTLSTFIKGRPLVSEKIFSYVSTETITIPQSMTDSLAKSTVAPTGSALFTITKNGSSVATINFPIGSTEGVFSSSAPITLSTGDVLSLVAPSTVDDTLSNITVSITALRG